MARSRVYPDPVWIRRADPGIDGVQLTLRGRWNVQELIVEEEEGAHTEYEYAECEFTATMPEDAIDPGQALTDQVAAWVSSNESALIAQAKRRYVLETGEPAE